MIVNCPTCTTRLQLDDAKIPDRAFSVRCPKCQQIINAEPPARREAGNAVDGARVVQPAPARTPQEASVSAPETLPDAEVNREELRATPVAGEEDLLRLLATLLRRAAGEEAARANVAPVRRPDWNQHRALLCVAPARRDEVARSLAETHYHVLAAKDTAQAMECLRDEKTDVLVLDNEFDAAAQGAIFINRELNAMRMADRRRLVLVQLSPSARTGDAHAAFLSNANLIVNNADVESLPLVIEKNVRELNELYRDFNKAINVAAL